MPPIIDLVPARRRPRWYTVAYIETEPQTLLSNATAEPLARFRAAGDAHTYAADVATRPGFAAAYAIVIK